MIESGKKKNEFRILFFFRIPHTKISLLFTLREAIFKNHADPKIDPYKF